MASIQRILCPSEQMNTNCFFPLSVKILTEIKILSCKIQHYVASHLISLECLQNQNSRPLEVKQFPIYFFLSLKYFPSKVRSLSFGYSWENIPLETTEKRLHSGSKKELKFCGSIKDGLKAVIVLKVNEGKTEGESKRKKVRVEFIIIGMFNLTT